ncbi:MAG TPA: hypothetical protein VIJ20_14675, partial [Solirubrobacteraceae bacterium]
MPPALATGVPPTVTPTLGRPPDCPGVTVAPTLGTPTAGTLPVAATVVVPALPALLPLPALPAPRRPAPALPESALVPELAAAVGVPGAG